MASNDAHSHFTSRLIKVLDVPRWNAHHVFHLNPPLIYASLLMQSLAVRGEVTAKLAQWLPSFVLGDEKLLRQSLAVIDSPDHVSQLVEQGKAQLSREQKHFVLMRLVDLMGYQTSISVEQKIHLEQLKSAWDIDTPQLLAGVETVRLKHSHSVLGPYVRPVDATATLTPHLLWACIMLYLMVADGQRESGHLEHIQRALADYPGLQTIAVRCARLNKVEQLMAQAGAQMGVEMQHFMLVQAAHLISLNGQVQPGKNRLFSQLMEAFALDQAECLRHFKTLAFLNRNVFSSSVMSDDADWSTSSESGKAPDSSKTYHLQSYSDNANDQGLLGIRQQTLEVDTVIANGGHMAVNIQQVHAGVAPSNTQKLAADETSSSRLKIQSSDRDSSIVKLDQVDRAAARLRLDQEASLANRQTIAEHGTLKNVQQLPTQASQPNIQEISVKGQTLNRQSLPQGSLALNRQRVSSEELGVNRQPLSDEDSTQNGERVPGEEKESLLGRWMQSWKTALASESDVFQRKAGIRRQIPPIIHRKRIVDFSSLNIYIEYDHERDPAVATSSLAPDKSYSYKLKTCLEVLNKHMDVVNQKLEMVESNKKKARYG